MGRVRIPKDLTKIDRKKALNLTKRQLCLIIPGTAAGIGAYLLTYKTLGSNAMYLIVLILIPIMVIALYKNRDNEKLEDIILRRIKFKLSRKTRTFKQKNVYCWIMRKEEKDAKEKAEAARKHSDQAGFKLNGKN